MRTETLGAVLSIVLAAPAAFADIVVLTTGERMDVESYEIQDRVVNIKTWDGRYRALPRTYVDVEATEKANDFATPEQRIAPARLKAARQACADYGIRGAVTVYHDVLESQIRRMRGHMSIQAYDQLRASFRNAFDDDRIFDAVAAQFASNASLDVLGSWTEWLATPFAERMVAMETDELDAKEAVAASAYYIELRSNEAAFEHRLELVNRLDNERKSTESGTEAVLYLVEAYYEAAKTVFPNEELEYDAEELREELIPLVKNARLRSLVILFRNASDDDLERYIEYWNTGDGQHVVALMNAAVEAGARHGSEVAMQMVAGKRHTVP